MAATKLSRGQMPKVKPARNEDGVHTGYYLTLQDSQPLSGPMVPAGTAITQCLSTGYDGTGRIVQRREIGLSGTKIEYLA